MSGSVTVTGLKELQAAAAALPERVRSTLRGVAEVTAMRIADRIRANAKARGWQTIPSEVTVQEPPGRNQFVVGVQPSGNRPANLPLWLEFGTVKMPARPFVLPAGEAERDGYAKAQEQAVVALLNQELGS